MTTAPFCSRLTQTDLALSALDGSVERFDGLVVSCQPNNPLYQWGNYLLLPQPPEADELDGWIEEFRRRFASQPEVKHVTLRWDGASLSEPAAALAKQRGMAADGGLEMVAEALSAPECPGLLIRELDMQRERDAIVALNIACDPTEQGDSESYVEFKQRLRRSWWAWHQSGSARWWGAFLDGELVAQCGLVHCPDALGRFQAVETHPAYRRRGVCSALVARVGNQALTEGGCQSVLLGADGEGPALGLYTRLGFRIGATQHGLILGGEGAQIRLEAAGDQAEVQSVISAAFGQPDEAALVAALREQSGVISLVAERGGTILAHALFTPVANGDTIETTRQGIALGPMAVRPSQQGQGFGSALIKEGLERCKEAGWSAAFVLGAPGYYQRFGWRPATAWGLRCRWEVPSGTFQALELTPGGLDGWQGLVRYDPAFDSLD